MNRFKFHFIVLPFCLISLLGQVDKKTNSFNKIWVTFNLGISGTGTETNNWNSGLYSSLGLNLSSPNNNIKLKYTNNMPGGLFSEFSQRVYDFGILYGFKPDFEYGNVILSGGISIVSGYYYKSKYEDSTGYTYDRESIYSVGFPFELQFDWNTFKYFGVGLSAFGNINFERIFYGAGLSVNIGKVR